MPDGSLQHIAGKYHWSQDIPQDGIGADSSIDEWRKSQTMAVDQNGNIFLTDVNAVRKITPAGQVSTLAGKLGWDDSEGYVDGPGSTARFNSLTGITVDSSGVVYVMDSDNRVIRKIQPDGSTSTFVGDAKIGNYFDAKGSKARLNQPRGLTIDSAGNLYFVDGSAIRKVKPDGTVLTIAGKLSPEHGKSQIRGRMGIIEKAGEVAIFGEDEVTGLAVDRRGTLYASFLNSIYEAESVFAPPSGGPFPAANSLPEVTEKPDVENPDSNPPELVNLTLETTTVDLTYGAVDIPFTLTFSDKIDFATIYFGSYNQLAGIASFGPQLNQLKGYIGIPSITKTGIYSLDSLHYHWGDYPNGQPIYLSGNSIPDAFKNIAITVTNPSTDDEEPVVHAVTLLSSEVNTSNSSAKIRYRVEISDNLSGFSWMNLSFMNTISNTSLNPDGLGAWNSLVAVNGDLKTYEGTIEIPQGSGYEGEWVLYGFNVQDRLGNSDYINLASDDPRAVKFTVSNSAVTPILPQAVSDQLPPELVSLELSSSSIDVSDKSQDVVITANWKDVLLGVMDADVELISPSGNTLWGWFEPVSGSAKNGNYSSTITVPRYSESGIWKLRVLAKDEARQSITYSDLIDPDYTNSVPFPSSISQKTISVASNNVDSTGPELSTLVFSNSTVDVSNDSQQVSITARLTDNLSGVSGVEFRLTSPSGNQTVWGEFDQESGTPKNGTYIADITIPRYSEPGVWTLSIWAEDETGNKSNYTNEMDDLDPEDKSFPESITNKSIAVVNAGDVDSSAPELTSLSLSTSSVTVSTDSQEVVITATWSDALSGVSWSQFEFTSPSGNHTIQGHFTKVGGSINNGTYQAKANIPAHAESGEWSLNISASDRLDNYRSYSIESDTGNNGYTTYPENITENKLEVDLTLNPENNNYAPWPVDLTFDRTSVDISEGEQKIKVRLTINNDDLPTNLSFSIGINLEDSHWYNALDISNFELVSGSTVHGVYEAEVTVPKFSRNGNYTVSYLYIYEYDYNQSNGTSRSYSRWGDSIPVELRKTFAVTGTQDITAPVLKNAVITPAAVDTRNGTVVVTANLTITDDQIGLENKENWPQAGSIRLVSPSGKELAMSEFTWANRVAGNSYNGTYQVQFELPQYSEAGTWRMDYIELTDANFNTRYLIPANLQAEGIATPTFTVEGHSRGWETVSSDEADDDSSAKAIVTKQSAKFWLPVENIDRNWTWGTGADGSLEYQWAVEFYGNADYAFSFSKWKEDNETASSGNFTQFLEAGQVNVMDDFESSESFIEGAAITASRDGERLLLELTDSEILHELQEKMPSYLTISSIDPLGDSYYRKVKVKYVKEDVQLVLGNLTHAYDGAEKTASVNTSPGNLTQAVTLTYDGVTTPPTAPGNYTVVAFMNDPNYAGRQVGTMTIAKQSQAIGALGQIGDKVYGAAPFAAIVPTASSGLPVTLSVKSGPATISANNTVTLTGAGTVVLAANQSGNETYNAATEVTTSFNVSNPPPPPAPSTGGGGGGGGGAPSGGGGGGEPEKSKKGKKGQDKNDDDDKKSSNKKSDKKDNDKKDSKRKDSNKKDSDKKSPGKKSSGGDSQKSGGGKKKSKK
jgi:hypothetical protein